MVFKNKNGKLSTMIVMINIGADIVQIKLDHFATSIKLCFLVLLSNFMFYCAWTKDFSLYKLIFQPYYCDPVQHSGVRYFILRC